MSKEVKKGAAGAGAPVSAPVAAKAKATADTKASSEGGAGTNSVGEAFNRLGEDSIAGLLESGGFLESGNGSEVLRSPDTSGEGDDAEAEAAGGDAGGVLKEALPEGDAPTEETETPAETPATEETPTEEEGTQGTEATESTEEEELSLTPEQQEAFNRRIGREVRKRKVLEESLQTATSKLAELEAAKGEPEPKAAVPPAAMAAGHGNPQVQAIDAELVQLNGLLAWCAENSAGATVGEGEKAREYSSQDVLLVQQKAMQKAAGLAGRREGLVMQLQAQWEQTVRGNYAEASKVYPWLNDEKSSEYREAFKLVKELPWLAQHPDMGRVLGDYLAGRKLREQTAAAAKGKPAAIVKPKIPMPPKLNGHTRTGTPALPNGRQTAQTAAMDKFAKTGDEKHLVGAIQAMM